MPQLFHRTEDAAITRRYGGRQAIRRAAIQIRSDADVLALREELEEAARARDAHITHVDLHRRLTFAQVTTITGACTGALCLAWLVVMRDTLSGIPLVVSLGALVAGLIVALFGIGAWRKVTRLDETLPNTLSAADVVDASTIRMLLGEHTGTAGTALLGAAALGEGLLAGIQVAQALDRAPAWLVLSFALATGLVMQALFVGLGVYYQRRVAGLRSRKRVWEAKAVSSADPSNTQSRADFEELAKILKAKTLTDRSLPSRREWAIAQWPLAAMVLLFGALILIRYLSNNAMMSTSTVVALSLFALLVAWVGTVIRAWWGPLDPELQHRATLIVSRFATPEALATYNDQIRQDHIRWARDFARAVDRVYRSNLARGDARFAANAPSLSMPFPHHTATDLRLAAVRGTQAATGGAT